jgi:RNA polymerase sigma factor for flagellar operon FliA
MQPQALDALWQRWRRGRDEAAREALLEAHLPLVMRVLARLKIGLPEAAARALHDDLKSAGLLGLVEAFGHFREGSGATFSTFATWRIRGAMLDELRRQDWISKHRRHRWKELQSAVRRAEQRLGRTAEEAEIAAEMGLKVEGLREELLDLGPASLVFLDGLGDDGAEAALGRLKGGSGSPGPEELALLGRTVGRLAELIGRLPENERLVMTLAVHEELGHKEIAAVLGVSPPRVSQIYSRAVLRLQVWFGAGKPNGKD